MLNGYAILPACVHHVCNDLFILGKIAKRRRFFMDMEMMRYHTLKSCPLYEVREGI
jgi:hypothetical protein